MNTTDRQKPEAGAAFSAAQLLEVFASAWPDREVEYHRLFLFDRLQRGEHDWNFLIITRREDSSRLELAAVAFELDAEGNVSTRLESRKASIPAVRVAEVVEGVILRLDEFGSDYTEYDLNEINGADSPVEKLAEITGTPTGISEEPDEHGDDVQSGDSDRH